MSSQHRKDAGESKGFRFSATLPEVSRRQALLILHELALDRLPDLGDQIHLLITADDARRLLEKGIQVRLLSVMPIAPLDRSLVATDAQTQQWLERRLKGVPRKGGG